MNLRNIILWIFIALIVFGLFNLFNNATENNKSVQLTYSQFLDEVEVGSIKDVVIKGNNITGSYEDGRSFKTYAANDPTLVDRLNERGVNISAAPLDDGYPSILGILISWFPMLLLIGVWIFFMRQMQGGKGGAMGFGRSKAKLLTENKNKVTFNDVAGIDEAKEELVEIVEFLKDPRKFQKLGGRIPKGALLIGPPGTGKTLLARAVAGEAGVPFFTISGSDFVEMFVGVGASRVRDMFEQGRRNAPCIIFIDEIDAVGRSRGAGLGGGNDEREQTLNQILVEMDGFEKNTNIILLAATNRPDVLDKALLRPGRFDRQIVVDVPDVNGREQILKIHTRKIPLNKNVDLKIIAKGTPGLVGADLENLVNESALLAARKNKKTVAMIDFEEAKDKVMMGNERKSMVLTDDDKKITAYHEAGHALVAYFTPGSDPVHKITIVPRGRALGLTAQLPERERFNYSTKYLLGRLDILMGGRSAEQIIFNDFTTGAGNDIAVATDIAKKMVCEWGMSSKIGPLTFGNKEEQVFLGKEISKPKDFSEEKSTIIDNEVTRLVQNAENNAIKLLKDNIVHLHNVANALIEKETIDGQEMIDIIKNKVSNDDNSVDSKDKTLKVRKSRRSNN